MPWICPHCRQSLHRHAEKNVYRCDNNHCFDIAKEGYINLIPVNQKGSKDPGDSKAMISARKAFLAAGYYAPLAHVLEPYIKDSMSVLEVGCGEGYYLRRFAEQAQSEFYGVDVSKHAIKAASKASKSDFKQHYAVASSFDLPLKHDSMDIIVRNFAPAPPQEISRVLKDDGLFIVVTPGRRHLFQLRQHIYPQATEHDAKVTAVENFTLLEQHSVQQHISINHSEHIQALLQMTPYYWQTSKDKQHSLRNLNELLCDIDLCISVYAKQRQS